MIPECLIECSRDLPTEELDKFEEWIINPGGLDYSKAVPDDSIQRNNETLYLRTVNNREHAALPPLPPSDADEKEEPQMMQIDGEEVEIQELGNGEVLLKNVSSNLAAMVVCGQKVPIISRGGVPH